MNTTILARDERWYDVARALAATSQCRYKFGAVIAYGNNVVSMGVNTLKTHPIMSKYGDHCISVHAELACILRAPTTDLEYTTLYVARYSTDSIASKPCRVCMGLILETKIKFIVYHDRYTLVKERLK